MGFGRRRAVGAESGEANDTGGNRSYKRNPHRRELRKLSGAIMASPPPGGGIGDSLVERLCLRPMTSSPSATR